jgi:hypothetical protein
MFQAAKVITYFKQIFNLEIYFSFPDKKELPAQGYMFPNAFGMSDIWIFFNPKKYLSASLQIIYISLSFYNFINSDNGRSPNQKTTKKV